MYLNIHYNKLNCICLQYSQRFIMVCDCVLEKYEFYSFDAFLNRQKAGKDRDSALYIEELGFHHADGLNFEIKG